MTDSKADLRLKKLKSPRAAAAAGILFAVLYGISLALVRLSIPANPLYDSADWLRTSARAITLALNIVPFAGIAFLWFIGVIRDHMGEQEDRLFATVFLGSSLLFLALTFIGAALAGGLVSSYDVQAKETVESGVYSYGRSVMYLIINVYAIRMAGVCMISLGTIWLRTGLMHRGWTIVTYLLALILLLSIEWSLWVTFIFPGWVLAVSISFLIRNYRQPQEVVEV